MVFKRQTNPRTFAGAERPEYESQVEVASTPDHLEDAIGIGQLPRALHHAAGCTRRYEDAYSLALAKIEIVTLDGRHHLLISGDTH